MRLGLKRAGDERWRRECGRDEDVELFEERANHPRRTSEISLGSDELSRGKLVAEEVERPRSVLAVGGFRVAPDVELRIENVVSHLTTNDREECAIETFAINWELDFLDFMSERGEKLHGVIECSDAIGVHGMSQERRAGKSYLQLPRIARHFIEERPLYRWCPVRCADVGT